MSQEPENPARVDSLVRQVARDCTGCGKCARSCGYLQRFGLPGDQAREVLAETFDPDQPFLCSLCGLCSEVCPVAIDPAAMFLGLRCARVDEGGGDFRQHRVLTGYERRGGSPLFSWFGLPRGCTTVFFPGCALPGTRARRVIDVYKYLSCRIPGLGLVLDCCTKPSHDLGRIRHFERMFGLLRQGLVEQGVEEVLVACPNCFRIFATHGRGLRVRTIYELLAGDAPPGSGLQGRVTVHDPCGVRQEKAVHSAVRSLVSGTGLAVEEMKHHGTATLCCGEGGAVGFLDRQLAERWGAVRAREAGGRRIITYCAGCTGYLGRLTPASHVLDLLFEPEATIQGREKVIRSPWTYLQRLLLKKRLRSIVRARVEGRRRSDGRISWIGRSQRSDI